MEAWLLNLIDLLALPQFGLSTVFVVSFISATLLPLGSEPAVFGLIKLNPHLFWPAILVATAGNTLGGAVSWWMGVGAHKVADKAHGAHIEEALWRQSLFAELAAHRRRPAVRRRRLAEAAVLAMRGLYGGRQIFSLPDHDHGAAAAVARLVRALRP